jgi:hypothetical protein
MSIPLCPIHEEPMKHDFGSWALKLLPQEVGPGPLFKCVCGQCGLHWGPQHEYFELRDGKPRYTNMHSTRRMRCREKGHGCLFVAAIDREANKWTWRCLHCDRTLRDSPGSWVTPPEW